MGIQTSNFTNVNQNKINKSIEYAAASIEHDRDIPSTDNSHASISMADRCKCLLEKEFLK